MLGPFTVGVGAKIGSNAVVTKEVPAGATAVGIPGRIIVKDDSEQEAKRQAMAEKLGFDAYGVSGDMPDPVARAIGQLLDHLQAVDGRIEGMCEALKGLGSDYCGKEPPSCATRILLACARIRATNLLPDAIWRGLCYDLRPSPSLNPTILIGLIVDLNSRKRGY